MACWNGFPGVSLVSERSIVDIEKLGRYDIIRVLGRGAMGVVYEGRDPNLDRQVAIKTIRVQSLSPQAASEYEGRFRTEARSVARLHHPNIVSVFDSGQDGDTAYLVMEFIQGEDLKHHLECGARFSVYSSIVMVHELLMALDHAHRQNVVHRDIKPANMLIEVSGRIKLTDFGVARIQEPDESNLTQVGGAVGTPKYMSPEQAKGLRGDSRSDVFSAGVVLYELLTGRLPFEGENQFVIIHQIVSHEAALPSSVNSDVPAAMDEVMARAMAKDPDKRYATARDFALALRSVAQQLVAVSGTQPGDVAGEIGKFLSNRPAHTGIDAPLRDGSNTGVFGPIGDVSLASTVSHEAELEAWSAVRDSFDPQDFQGFLARFPSGIYARRAQQRINSLAAGDTASGAPTVPMERFLNDDPDLATTLGYSVSTLPMAADIQTGTGSQTRPVEPAGTQPVIAVPRGKTRLAVVVGGLVCAVVALLVFFRPTGSVEPVAQPVLVAQAVVAPPVALPLPSASIVAAPASMPAAASHAASALPDGAAKSIVLAPPLPAPSRPIKPKAVDPLAANAPLSAGEPMVAPVAQRLGMGPSMPGQVCADRVFIFRIACIAEQCATDRYRQTPECLSFKEMEKSREDERNSRR
jgi:serine/threonine protein kinase